MMTLRTLIFIAFGGAVGSILRYLVSVFMQRFGTAFVWGTLVANLLGCLLIGTFFVLSNKLGWFNGDLKLLFTVGLCGGFTTFSTFTFEFFQLLQSGQVVYAFSYALGSIFLGLIGVFLGIQITQNILS